MVATANRQSEIIILVIRSAIVLTAVVGLACKAHMHQLPSVARAAVGAAAKRFATWRRGEAQGDEADLIVESRLTELRLEHFRWGSLGVWLCILPVDTILVYSVLRHEAVYGLVSDLVVLETHAVITLVAMCPCIVSPRTVDIIYGVMTTNLALWVSPWAMEGSKNFPYVLLAANLILIYLNMLRRSVLVSLVFNLLFASAVSSSVFVHALEFTNFPGQLALLQFSAALVFPAFAKLLDEGMRVVIRRGLEMHAMKEVLEAACALLRSSCEVVVELDGTGAIVNEASELGGFLLQGTNRNFRGRVLADFIAEAAEREAFVGKLSAPAASEGHAQAMHVRMRDANGERLRVELMWFGFHHMDGQQRYMLGLREWNDHTGQRIADGVTSSRDLPTAPREDAAQGSPRLPSDDISIDISMSSSSAETLDAVAIVDTTAVGLPVQFCSEGFRSRVGRLERGFSMASLIEGGDAFEHWVQRVANDCIVVGRNSGTLTQEDDELDLHWTDSREFPRCSATFRMRRGQMDATCSLIFEAGQPADRTHVQLLLSDIKWDHDRRKKARSRRRAPPTRDTLRGTPTTLASV